MRPSLFLIGLFALMALGPFASAYTDRAFTLDVQLKPDGGAHVVERTLLNLDTDTEIQAFEFVLREGKTSLADFQKFSRNVRYHVNGSVFNLRVVAAREFATSFTSASVTLEYDIENVTVLRTLSSRTTGYNVQMNKFVLGPTPPEIRLGSNVIFILRLPKDAVRVRVSPDAGTTREANVQRWVGPTVGTWDVYFEREIGLADEVNLFFLVGYRALSSSYVVWLLLLSAVAVIGYKILQSRG